MSNGQQHRLPRAFTRVSLIGAAALLGSLVVAPTPGFANPSGPPTPAGGQQNAQPTIASVQARLSQLDHEAEIAAEDFNTVRVQMQAAGRRLTTLQADVKSQRHRVAVLRDQVVGSAISDYQNAAGLSSTTSFLISHDPSKFVTNLADTSVVEHQQAGALTALEQQQNQLGIGQRQAAREVAVISADKAKLAAHKAVVEHKMLQARNLLSRLKAQERARLLAIQKHQQELALARSRAAAAAAAAANTAPAAPTTTAPAAPTTTGNGGTPSQSRSTTTYSQPSRSSSRPARAPSPPASGRAATAVSYALAHLGDPYAWAAAGPNAFDCSGLTMAAWGAAGVSLPHSAAMQASMGTPVSTSQLQPGDLVFYYSPISHVGMYIGNGQIVHAPHSGSVVQIVPLTSMPIAAARRVG
ncbi:MAG: NlpC/P60 family protein [Nocardioidaceae bacterium]